MNEIIKQAGTAVIKTLFMLWFCDEYRLAVPDY